MKILWAITGAGHFLAESLNILEKLALDDNIITITTTKAADEVIQLYGFSEKIENIVSLNYENKHIKDEDQEFSYPLSGKLTHQKYDVIIIAPLTANSTAKIVHGIADTLITNIAAQSGKGQIPLIVLPVDQTPGVITTIIPPYIKKDRCVVHENCIPMRLCPNDAINPPHIDKSKCISCHMCKDICINDALVVDEKIELYIRKIDAQNTQKLATIENIKTVYQPEQLVEYIKKIEKE